MMEQMTHNTIHDNKSLWLPKALHWHHTQHQSSKTSQLPAHLPACQPSLFPPLTTMTIANNILAANQTLANGNSALTTTFMWMTICQCHHQHPIHPPWATNYMAIDHRL